MVLLKLSPAQESLRAWWQPQEQPSRNSVKAPEATGTLPGLANLGNTCFANSVLQCLLNTPGWFAEACWAFDQGDELKHSQKAALGRSFARLAREYGSSQDTSLRKSNAALKNMKDAIAAVDSRYAGCQQQDAYEFLGCLLEGLEDSFGALYRGLSDDCNSPNAGVIRAICGITTHTTRVCQRCSGCFEVDRVTDTAMRLPLISPAAQYDASLRETEEQTPISVQELIAMSQRAETIDGYDCDACRDSSTKQGQEHSRSSMTQHANEISASRDVLVVVLYRFAHALDSAGRFSPTKVRRQVSCPTELALETGSYRLFGMVSHLGNSLTAGHYVAAVRSRRDDIWYECNDETVTPLNLKALYDGRSVTSVRPGAEPYILFYHRQQATQVSGAQADAEKADVTHGMRASVLDRPLADPAMYPTTSATEVATDVKSNVGTQMIDSDVPNKCDAAAGDSMCLSSAKPPMQGEVVETSMAPGSENTTDLPISMNETQVDDAADCPKELNTIESQADALVVADTSLNEQGLAADDDLEDWVVVSAETSNVQSQSCEDGLSKDSATEDVVDNGPKADCESSHERHVRRRISDWVVTPCQQGRSMSAGDVRPELPSARSCPFFSRAIRRGYSALAGACSPVGRHARNNSGPPDVSAVEEELKYFFAQQACAQPLP